MQLQETLLLLTHAYFEQCHHIQEAQKKHNDELFKTSQEKKAYITVYYEILIGHMRSSTNPDGLSMTDKINIPSVKNYLDENQFHRKSQKIMLVNLPKDEQGLIHLASALKHVEEDTLDDQVLSILEDLKSKISQIRNMPKMLVQNPRSPFIQPAVSPVKNNHLKNEHYGNGPKEREILERKQPISSARLLLLQNQQHSHQQRVRYYAEPKKLPW